MHERPHLTVALYMEHSREVPYQHTDSTTKITSTQNPSYQKMKKKFVERCGVALDELRHTRGKK